MRIGAKQVSIEPLELVEDRPSTNLPQASGRVPEVRLKYRGIPPKAVADDCLLASKVPYMQFAVEYLNPLQTAFVPQIEQDNNVVVAGATSCGKTLIAEMVIAYALKEVRKTWPTAKAAYISPLKALTSEKEQDWRSPNHDFYQYNLSILTGDYVLTPERKEELQKADIVCMSSEMLGSRIRRNGTEHNNFLQDFAVMVVDEAHCLTMQERGPHIEVALMKFTEANSKCRIIFLSATMPNVAQIGEWLTHLNGKPTTVVKSDYRPVDLTWNWEEYEYSPQYQQNEHNKICKVMYLLNYYKQDKFLVFVHAKKIGYKILNLLKEGGIPAAFHNADMGLEARSKMEAEFKSREPGSLRVLVATSTLAYGLNVPARRAIIVGIHRGRDLVDTMDIIQEAGRSGRIGLDPAGDAHVLISNNPKMKLNEIAHCQTMPDIVSQINNEHILAFHLVSEIAEGAVKTKAQALEWFKRSLCWFQNIFGTPEKTEAFMEQVLAELLKCRAIDQVKGRYKATAIGKVASWFYFSPFDVSDWASNLHRALHDKELNPTTLAWALANTHTARQDFGSPNLAESFNPLCKQLQGAGYFVCDSLGKQLVAYNHLLTGTEPQVKELNVVVGALRKDAPRTVAAIQALRAVGGMFRGAPHEAVVYELGPRLNYGMGDRCLELLCIPHIGRKTAEQLAGRGITTAKQLVAAQTYEVKAVTDTLWNRIKAEAMEVAQVGHLTYLKRRITGHGRK